MGESEKPSTPMTIFGHPISLAGALVIIVLVALLLVMISYVMYLNSPASKYDLARPGGREDNALITERDENADTTSRVDVETVEKNLESLKQNISALQSANDFGEQDLSNQNLGLEPSTQPSL